MKSGTSEYSRFLLGGYLSPKYSYRRIARWFDATYQVGAADLANRKATDMGASSRLSPTTPFATSQPSNRATPLSPTREREVGRVRGSLTARSSAIITPSPDHLPRLFAYPQPNPTSDGLGLASQARYLSHPLRRRITSRLTQHQKALGNHPRKPFDALKRKSLHSSCQSHDRSADTQ